MTAYFDELVGAELVPGRYRLGRPVPVRALRDELAEAGWTTLIVDGASMIDRRTLFEAFAAGFDFPSWFGGTWDGFADCLRDLSWLPQRPTVALWQRSGEFEAADPDIWRTAGQVIDTAIDDRVEAGSPPLYVIYPPTPDLIDGGGPMLRPVR